jgi:hypothetical protein
MEDPLDYGKYDKSSVDYSLGGEHCHACKFFIENENGDAQETSQGEMGRCQRVKGEIGEHMWCRLFEWMVKPKE